MVAWVALRYLDHSQTIVRDHQCRHIPNPMENCCASLNRWGAPHCFTQFSFNIANRSIQRYVTLSTMIDKDINSGRFDNCKIRKHAQTLYIVYLCMTRRKTVID